MRILSFVFLFLIGGPLFADIPLDSAPTNQAIFTQVQGDVQIETGKYQKVEKARKDQVVVEGDRIVTQDNSSAVLRLFDGSQLTISPQTDFILSQLQQSPTHDKFLHFKLFLGKLAAEVKELTTAQSSFEIESGGVVCGVRGTQFSMAVDPHQHTVQLDVIEGKVWARSKGGPEQIFTAGQQQLFTNIHVANPSGANNQGEKTALVTTNSNTNSNTNTTTTTDILSDPSLEIITSGVPKLVTTNNNNTLNTTQQTSNIGLHVGPGEVIP
jgi:hypothetical protein